MERRCNRTLTCPCRRQQRSGYLQPRPLLGRTRCHAPMVERSSRYAPRRRGRLAVQQIGMSAYGDRLLAKVELIPGRVHPILRRIGDPASDFRLSPPSAVGADRYLARECAFGNLAINGRAGQPGSIKDGFEADDTVRVGHGRGSIRCVCMTPPANNLGRAARDEKNVFGASKCSEEKAARGGFKCMISLNTERQFRG